MNRLPPESRWSILLDLALTALDTLPDTPSWSWGGGTALAVHLDHRVSYDIDIFLSDANALRSLSPQRNPAVRAISESWQEPGHYLKLERPEGEIDFIVASLRTEPGITPWPHQGRNVPLETPAEVLAKKFHFRGSTPVARDFFDMEAVRRFDAAGFALAVATEPDGAGRAADFVSRNVTRLRREMPLAVNPTPKGQEIVETIDLLDLAAELKG